jgi:flagellar secretion chaperone FliS
MNGQQNHYLKNAVLQASPEQLQLMLYDGAIRYALKGRDAIESKNYEQIYECFTRAQRIVLEMQAGLNPEVNAELCDQMSALYNFVYRCLIDAGVKRDVQSVDDAVKILQHQRETWVMLLDKVSKEHADHPVESLAGPIEAGSLSVEG